MGDALAPEIAATDYHTAGEPFRIVTAGVPPIAGATVRERREHAAASEPVDDGAPAALPRAARARGHVRLLPRPARRRRRRPRRALLAQGRLLDRVRARDDRARRLGGRVRGAGRAARRRGRRHDRRALRPRRRARPRRAAGSSRRSRFATCRRSWSRATCRPRASRSTWPTAARSTPRCPPSASGCASRPTTCPRSSPPGARSSRRSAGTDVARHPDDERLSGIYGTILYEDARRPAPAQRDDLRRRRGRSLALRLGDLGALRPAGRRRALGEGDVLRHDSIVGSTFHGARGRARRPTACSPRSRGWPTAPASTASSSTRATRWAPASSCDEPALPRRRGHRRAPQPDGSDRRAEAALLAGLDPEADPPRGALAVGGGELLVMPSATARATRSSSS